MLTNIKQVIEKLDSLTKTKSIRVISHFDTDGITSAAIFSKALKRWHKNFSLQIVKNLEESIIKSLPEDQILVFLDLASNSLNYLAEKKTNIFIFDHHEIIQKIPENVTMINPLIFNHEPIASSGICYLFAKSLSEQNKDLANLAIIGMIGDAHEKNIGKTYSEILKDSGTTIKKGLLLYPSTRPLDRTLEYSSSPYIPGVTSSFKGVLEILREANIQKNGKEFKSLHELNEEEMINLTTAIMLRLSKKSPHNERELQNLIGNIYLVKFFNKLEDARELSALINACSRMDRPEVSLGFCLNSRFHKELAEKIYIEYKQHLISALKYFSETQEKIFGNKYAIINAKDKIKDTIIGTVISIISHSPAYEEGTIIIALAYNQDKIKVSARIAGHSDKNVREVLNKAVISFGGEVGGHSSAAGCLISKEKEEAFIQELQKVLEVEPLKA